MIEKVPPSWRSAEEIRPRLRALIDAHHEHLKECPIFLVFNSDCKTSRGKSVQACVEKLSGYSSWLAQCAFGQELGIKVSKPNPFTPVPVFVIKVWEDFWNDASEEIQNAVLDHELCHIQKGEEGQFGIVGHDLEEFAAVIDRHGAYDADIQRIARAIKKRLKTDNQLMLLEESA